MAPVPLVGSVQTATPASRGGHGNQITNHSPPALGQPFSSALSQAIGQASAGGHAGHGASPGTVALPRANSPNSMGSSQSGTSRPRHFTIGESHQGENHGFQETALSVRAYRQQLIASNIANADTPGYQAVDIDFAEVLRIARSIANTPPISLATTSSAHIQGQAQSNTMPFPLKYHSPLQPSVDGNTVDMDIERAKLAENALMWEFSRDRVSVDFKHKMEMLQNLRD